MTRSAIRYLTHQIPCALENSREQKKHERTSAIFILFHFPLLRFYLNTEHRVKIFRGESPRSEKNEENRKRSSGRFHAKIQKIEFKLSRIYPMSIEEYFTPYNKGSSSRLFIAQVGNSAISVTLSGFIIVPGNNP